MKKLILFHSIYCVIVLITCVAFTSCEKISGHAISPTTGSHTPSGGSSPGTPATGCKIVAYTGPTPNTNGIGTIAVGAANTLIFQVNNDAPYTVPFSTYPLVLGFQSTGSTTNGPITAITALDIVSGNNVIINYNSLSTGLYDAAVFNIAIPPYDDLVSSTVYNLGTEKFNVTTENVTGDPTTPAGSMTGTIKGTFDGYMVDSCMNKYRVSGSFNLSK